MAHRAGLWQCLLAHPMGRLSGLALVLPISRDNGIKFNAGNQQFAAVGEVEFDQPVPVFFPQEPVLLHPVGPRCFTAL
jgi:hypothetical protein